MLFDRRINNYNTTRFFTTTITIIIMIIMEFSNSTLLLSLISVFHYNYYYTVWIFNNFAVNQILCEINIGKESQKVEFRFWYISVLIWDTKLALSDFTQNLSDRRILKFLHCILLLLTLCSSTSLQDLSSRNISIPYYYYEKNFAALKKNNWCIVSNVLENKKLL